MQPAGDADLPWRDVLTLDQTDYAQGWRIHRLICDTQAPNACLAERRRAGAVELAPLDLSDPTAARWTPSAPGAVLDYDAGSSSVLKQAQSAEGLPELRHEGLTAQSARVLWRATPANRNATAKFLRGDGPTRPVLLLTGGLTVKWQVVEGDRRSEIRAAPGVPSAAFSDNIYFLMTSPDRQTSWFGFSALPLGGGPWGQDRLMHQGGAASPPIMAYQTPGDLWPLKQATAFLGNGALLAVTGSRDALRVSEVCKPEGEADVLAQPIDSLDNWLVGAAEVTVSGGAPSSRIVLVSRRGLDGRLAVRAVFAGTAAARPEAIGVCGQTTISTVDLPLPDARTTSDDLERTVRSVESTDGAVVTYDVIRRAGQVGQVLIRPYGAYGLNPDAYLARPLEQQWVAQGNTLVIPRLRGDGGSPSWIEAGRGDYKARSADDLIAVTQDILRRDAVAKVNLFGFSAGGFVSAKAALKRPELFDRVIMVSAVSDLSLIGAEDANSFDRAEFGSPDGGFATWLGGTTAGASAPRFILLHGDKDDVVPLASSSSFAAYARSLGYDVKGQIYQGVGHNLANTAYVLSDIEELW